MSRKILENRLKRRQMAKIDKTTKRHEIIKSQDGVLYSHKEYMSPKIPEKDLDTESEIQLGHTSDSIASKVLLDFKKSNIDYEYEIVELEKIKHEEYVGKPIKFVGFVQYISEPYPYTNQHGKNYQRVTVYDLVLIDEAGETIEVLPILYNNFKDQLNLIRLERKKLTFYGTIISIDNKKVSKYVFLLTKISSVLRSSELLNIKKKEGEKYDNILNSIRNRSTSLRKYIKDKLAVNLGIMGLDKAKELSTALDFIILQSFSNGLSQDGRYSYKLHSLVIGPPASGKKLLTKAALMLNLYHFEVQPTSGKITPAGLIGNVIRRGGKIFTDPGILSKASSGVVCIQDYHELAKKASSNFSDVLSKVMEDGEVIDSTSSKTRLQAVTSIHLDMNRISHVQKTTSTNFYDDLKIPLNIISRFDFIIEIPSDVRRQIDIVTDMMEGKKVFSTSDELANTPEWIKELQYLIETTKEMYPSITADQSISAYVRDKLNSFLEENENYIDLMNTFGSMLTRIEITLEKLQRAIACSEMSKEVTEAHVDEAFKFLSHKLEFLKNLDPISVSDSMSERLSDAKRRQAKILEVLKQKPSLETKEIHKVVKKSLGKDCSLKTIQRDLSSLKNENIIISMARGIWGLTDHKVVKENPTKTSKKKVKNEITITTVAADSGWLSCMSAHPITYQGEDYRTAEALFQCLRFHKYPEIQELIREQKSPMGAKMKARKNRELLNRGIKWDEAPEDIPWMKKCLELKLEQHPLLKKKLLDTGSAEIIEDCTTHDRESSRFWGAVKKDGIWLGDNKLGKLWMEIRNKLNKP